MSQDDESSRKLQRDSVNIETAAGPGGGALNVKFVGSGLLLFLDYLFVAIGGWLFWIIISRVASINEIGMATTIYSLVISVATIIMAIQVNSCNEPSYMLLMTSMMMGIAAMLIAT